MGNKAGKENSPVGEWILEVQPLGTRVTELGSKVVKLPGLGLSCQHAPENAIQINFHVGEDMSPSFSAVSKVGLLFFVDAQVCC